MEERDAEILFEVGDLVKYSYRGLEEMELDGAENIGERYDDIGMVIKVESTEYAEGQIQVRERGSILKVKWIKRDIIAQEWVQYLIHAKDANSQEQLDIHYHLRKVFKDSYDDSEDHRLKFIDPANHPLPPELW